MKKVVRFPMALTAAGAVVMDDSHSTGLRLLVSVVKGTLLDRPKQGITLSLLEQATLQITEDKFVILAVVLSDILSFIPTLNVVGMDIIRDPNIPRRIIIKVLYKARQDLSKVFSFDWGVNL